MTDAPDLVVTSRDGTSIAGYRSGTPGGPPLILVHGASADHTTSFPCFAVTVDLVVLTVRGDALCALAVRRGVAPCRGENSYV